MSGTQRYAVFLKKTGPVEGTAAEKRQASLQMGAEVVETFITWLSEQKLHVEDVDKNPPIRIVHLTCAEEVIKQIKSSPLVEMVVPTDVPGHLIQ